MNRLLRTLIDAVNPDATNWDPVYDGDLIVGFDIDNVRLTLLR